MSFLYRGEYYGRVNTSESKNGTLRGLVHKGGEKSWRAWLDLTHTRLKEKNLDDFEGTPPHSVLQWLSLQILVIHTAEKANGQLGLGSVSHWE